MTVQKYTPLIARSAIAIIFLNLGIGKLSNFSGIVEQIAGAGLPLAGLVAICTIAFQLLGGAALVLGYKARIGAWLLIAFLIPATLVFHNPMVDPSQMIQFLKNLAIIGGLLMIVAYGAGPVSLDNRLASSPATTAYSEDSLR
ncbi:hypothetical protein N836_21095 [Leptolyngbya sp. Heron Island J]|uniref:DoxX family protein n=1 Tax=Leptolyngbya sp. Heron Island J TaxID=1385935 RepID=UPI0003B9B3D2|nr:DoxX family protein [Leptolyngbya sp. Heron Island J]ESA33579.1 hypothetical protein N836_21095 [Leptolyngbya sp. Heron Island J]